MEAERKLREQQDAEYALTLFFLRYYLICSMIFYYFWKYESESEFR